MRWSAHNNEVKTHLRDTKLEPARKPDWRSHSLPQIIVLHAVVGPCVALLGGFSVANPPQIEVQSGSFICLVDYFA